MLASEEERKAAILARKTGFRESSRGGKGKNLRTGKCKTMDGKASKYTETKRVQGYSPRESW